MKNVSASFWRAQPRNSEQPSDEVCQDSYAIGERFASQLSGANTER